MRLRRFFVSAILILAPLSALACGDVFESIAQTVSGVLNPIYDYLGSSSVCSQGRVDGKAFTCSQFAVADQKYFSANLLGKCTDPNALQFLEVLQVTEVLEPTFLSASCSLNFLDQLKTNPNAPALQMLFNRAYDVCMTIGPALQDLSYRETAIQSAYDHGCARPDFADDDDAGDTRACEGADERAAELRSAQRGRSEELVKVRQTMDALLSSVPYATDPKIRSFVSRSCRETSKPMSKTEFFSRYSQGLFGLRAELTGIRDRIAAIRKPQPNGQQPVYSISAGLRDEYVYSPAYRHVVAQKEKLPPDMKYLLMCRADSREKGKVIANDALMLGSVASAMFTGGLSLTGVSLSSASRAALVTADLALTGAGSVAALGVSYDSCYKDATLTPQSAQCSPQEGLSGEIARTSRSQCVLDLATASLPVAIAGASLAAKMALKSKFPRVSAEAAELPEEPSMLASKPLDEISDPLEVVVVGSRSRTRSTKAKASNSDGKGETVGGTAARGAKPAVRPNDDARAVEREAATPDAVETDLGAPAKPLGPVTETERKAAEIEGEMRKLARKKPITAAEQQRFYELDDQMVELVAAELKRKGISFSIKDPSSALRGIVGKPLLGGKQIFIEPGRSNPSILNKMIERYDAEIVIAPGLRAVTGGVGGAASNGLRPRIYYPIEELLRGEYQPSTIVLHELRHMSNAQKVAQGRELPYSIELRANPGETLHPHGDFYNRVMSLDELSTWDRDMQYVSSAAFRNVPRRHYSDGRVIDRAMGAGARWDTALHLKVIAKSSESGIESARAVIKANPSSVVFKFPERAGEPTLVTLPYVRDGREIGKITVHLANVSSRTQAEGLRALDQYLERAYRVSKAHEDRADHVLIGEFGKKPPPDALTRLD